MNSIFLPLRWDPQQKVQFHCQILSNFLKISKSQKTRGDIYQGRAKSETCRTKIFSSVNFWSRLWFKIKLSFFFTFRCSLWWHFRCRWKLRLKLEDLFFSQNLSIEDCGLRFLERFFTQMKIFFLKLGCKRQVLSELGIKTTLIFSLSFDKVFHFCVPLSIRWSNQHWVEKPHHFVVVQERTFWREKNSFNFLARKMIVSFSTNFFGEPQRTK